MSFVKEFREFALRGNVMDMAVGVIIGGAFGTIINSMINDILMPVVGIAGKADFSNMYFGLTETAREKIEAATTAANGVAPTLVDARAMGPVLAYGNFITVALNFVILAFCIFLMIKAMNTARKRFEHEKPAAPPPGPTPDQKLLTEIRDLLAKRG
ncbi:MAG: large conductance mechanosensitive channel protein MscL [Phycisphaeraceae bacterium]|nr:large conductance mechanosensitive channel protein MscL [Phycisphaeraceae bacterium]